MTSAAAKGHSGRMHSRWKEDEGATGGLVTALPELSSKRHVWFTPVWNPNPSMDTDTPPLAVRVCDSPGEMAETVPSNVRTAEDSEDPEEVVLENPGEVVP